MTAPSIIAVYLPGLGSPALCVDQYTHAMSVEVMESLIAEMQFAVLRARIDAKKRSTAQRLVTPENEMAQLLQMVDMQLATPEAFPKSSPASEVTP